MVHGMHELAPASQGPPGTSSSCFEPCRAQVSAETLCTNKTLGVIGMSASGVVASCQMRIDGIFYQCIVERVLP